MATSYTPTNTLKFATICSTNNHTGQIAKRFANEWRQIRWDQAHAEEYLDNLSRATDLHSDLTPTSTPAKLALELAEFHMQISKYARSATAMEGSRVAHLLFNTLISLEPSSSLGDLAELSRRLVEKPFLKKYKGTGRLSMFMNSLRVEFDTLVAQSLGPRGRAAAPVLLEGGVYHGEGYWRYPVGSGWARGEDSVGASHLSSPSDERESLPGSGGS